MDRKALMETCIAFFICCAILIHFSELCEVNLASYLVFKVTIAQLCYLISTVVQGDYYAGNYCYLNPLQDLQCLFQGMARFWARHFFRLLYY